MGKLKLSRKELAQYRQRGSGGKFVKGLTQDGVLKYNLPASIVPDAHVDHVATFRAVPNLPAKVYRNLDEALRDDQVNARAMRRDPFITELLFSRQMTVAELPWELVPEDPKDPFQKYACDYLTDVLNDIPRFTEYKRNLLEAVWYGRYMIINNFGFDWKKNKRRMVVKEWQPVMGDKIQFRMHKDEIGYLVNPAMSSGLRPIEIGYDGPIEIFTETDRKCCVVHKHFISDAHFMEWEMAGGIHGVGLRNYLYWAWYHRQELIAWIFSALERYGFGGFQIWYFEAGNPESEAAVRDAAEKQTQNNVILFPRPIGSEKQGPGLDIVEPKGAGLDTFLHLIDDYFNKQIRRMIIGSSGEDKTDTGGSSLNANIEQDSFARIIRYDADNLSETLTRELVTVLKDYNFPGATWSVKLKFNVQKPDPEKVLEAAQRLFEMGAAIDETEIRSFVGLSEPDSGSKTLKKTEGEDQTIKQPRKNTGNLMEQLS